MVFIIINITAPALGAEARARTAELRGPGRAPCVCPERRPSRARAGLGGRAF